ncbi:MAG: twin-arginine translocation signal domain-containing protein [Candidatus Hydrogenedens sp.]|nr:twin-arginine translocation signal domain-containing protein [Candidatus Hydrogenedens sp.]
MNPKMPHLDRRGFLKAGALAAAAVSAGADDAPKATAPKPIKTAGTMPERVLGRTGYSMPVFGHGGSAMFKGDIAYYGVDLPPLEARIAMVRDGYEKGIRYFDTARIYGESEEIMGAALKDVRENVFIASKAMVAEVDRVRSSVERSLEALGMDYVDSMQIHGPIIERLGYDGCMPIYEEMAKLRDEGLIRFIGITGHSRFEEMYKLIDSGQFDTLLIEFGFFHKGYNTRHSEESVAWREKTVARAAEVNTGVVAMKVLGAWIYSHNSSNLIPDFDEEKRKGLAAAAIRHVLSDERVSVLNIGISLPEDIDANLAILNGDTTYTEADKALLAEFADRAYQHPMVQELKLV